MIQKGTNLFEERIRKTGRKQVYVIEVFYYLKYFDGQGGKMSLTSHYAWNFHNWKVFLVSSRIF